MRLLSNELSNENISKKSFIKEGSAEILNEGNVFYNPVQEFNRDLSLSVISTFSKIYQTELTQKNIKNQSKKVQLDPVETSESVLKDNITANDVNVKTGQKLEVKSFWFL